MKRRLMTVAAVMLLLMVGAALFFYRPTRRALERAEAFQFQRMTVNKLGDADAYRFFFISNRILEAGQGPIAERFGNRREMPLKFGSFDTAIKPTLGIGMLINATDWFQNEEIRLLRVRSLQQDMFIEEIRRQVQTSPYQALLVNVNGFRDRFSSALRKTAFLSHILDIDAPVLVFDWPGNQGATLRGYRRALQIAMESGGELAQALKTIIDEIQPARLWLVANSMGAQVVVHAFSILYQDADMADPSPEIENIVLTAPDVDKNEFDEQFKREIAALSANLTVYVSSNDRALLASRFINRGRRLGESTLDPANPDLFQEAADIYQLTTPDDPLITLVDVTPVNRTRNFHSFSLEAPQFFDDLYLRLVNEDMPRSRLEYRIEGTSGNVYRVLTRGR